MKKVIVVILVCLLCFGVAIGASCLTSREFTDVAAAVRAQMYPAQLTTTFKLRCGPMMIFAAKMLIKNAMETPAVSEYLQDIHNVQMGLYAVQPSQNSSPVNSLLEAEQHLTGLGWEPFVRVRDRGQHVSLFYKPINERIAGVYVVVLDRERLVVVEIQGRLDNLIEKALQDPGFPGEFEML